MSKIIIKLDEYKIVGLKFGLIPESHILIMNDETGSVHWINRELGNDTFVKISFDEMDRLHMESVSMGGGANNEYLDL